MLAETPLRILVLDAHELAGLGAARSLGRAGHQVIAAFPDDAPYPATALSRYSSELRRGPHPWRRQLAYQGWLAGLLRRERFDAVLPISEASMVAAAALRASPEAPRGGPLWLMTDEAGLRVALSKHHATRAARELGVPVPRTAFLAAATSATEELWDWDQPARAPGGGAPPSLEQLSALLSQAGLRYPLLLKSDNHLAASGVYHKGQTVQVTRPSEALAALAALHEHGAAVIAQELIPGHGAGAFLLRQGDQTLLRFAHRRLHEIPYSGGVSSYRVSVHAPALLAHAERLLGGLRYQGVAMVEFRVGADGVPYFLEINGRLWGSLALALHAGVDFPLELLQAQRRAAAQVLPLRRAPRRLPVLSQGAAPQQAAAAAPRYPAGVRCRNVFPGEILHVFSILGAAELPPRRKAQALWTFLRLSLDPRVHHDYLWRDDPLPAVLQAARGTLEVAARLWGRGRDRLVRAIEERALRATPPTAALAALAALRQAPGGAPLQVLVLCHGNICRSPYAARYLNQRQDPARWPLKAESAGLSARDGRRTPLRFRVLARALEKDGAAPAAVDLATHRARAVTEQDLRQADLVLVMDGANQRALLRRFPAVRDKTFALGAFGPGVAPGARPAIPDPFLADPAEARRSYQALCAALEGLLQALPPRATAGVAEAPRTRSHQRRGP